MQQRVFRTWCMLTGPRPHHRQERAMNTRQPRRKAQPCARRSFQTRLYASSTPAGTEVLGKERAAQTQSPGAGVEESQDVSSASTSSFDDFILGPPLPITEPMAVVVGGGPCGALLSLLLAEQGWLVNLYEKETRLPGAARPGVAWNVVLGHRSMLALEQCGALQAAVSRSVELLGQVRCKCKDIKMKHLQYPFSALCISEAELAEVLVQIGRQRFPRQIRYHLGHRCTGVDFDKNTAVFVSENSSDAERLAASAITIKKCPPADLLVGADGVNSVMRIGMQSHAPMFGFSQVFNPDQIYRAVRVTLRPGALASDRRTMKPRRALHQRGNNILQLADALYVLRRMFKGAPVTCRLMPNADRSYSMVIGGRALAHCTNADHFRHLFDTSFPEVALLVPDSAYGALAGAPLQAFPTVTCSRLHHNRAVLIGAAAHAMFPDTQLSTDAGFEDCMALSSELRDGPAFPNSEQVRSTLELLSRWQRPAAAAAAQLAETAAYGRFPLSSLLSRIRFRVLLGCSNSLRILDFLPWELKALGTGCSYQQLQRWRSQEALAVTFLVLCGASVLAVTLWLLAGHTHMEARLSSLGLESWTQGVAGDLSRGLQRLAPPGSSRLWVAVAASMADARRALCSRFSWLC